MLVNDKFIFLQLQKTACTHVERIMYNLFPDTKQIGKHYKVPTDFNIGERTVLGSIRNPFDWYLSYWTYSCLAKGGPFKRTCSHKSLKNVMKNERINNSHNELPRPLRSLCQHTLYEFTRPVNYWKYLYEDANDPHRFRLWLKLVLDDKRKFDLFQDYGISTVSNFAGIYTYLVLFLYTKDFNKLFSKDLTYSTIDKMNLVVDEFLRTENISSDFTKVLKEMSIPISESISKDLQGKTNSSKRIHHRDFYYDDETFNLVKDKEKYI
ncbi:hypothetical protein BIZ37_29760, partial [Photobacterium sp. BZF1]|uniref:hypothetical protein n=1 Tax=Photobacterium sp. BZF1 TaxID=1904457 RepID=UPI0016535037